ncbi:MAG: sensor histidine kinase [Deltaproteobacteria bacterium]|nr:sensor histidine kinase [Deltaproteobacteria bacterium]
MEDLSLHILDLVENATMAGATRVEIAVTLDNRRNLLKIRIEDNGRGMDKRMLAQVRDPFTTTRTTRRVGLGISLMEQAAREAGGELEIFSEPGVGTVITTTFEADHIDRKPLGDMGATVVAIISGNPDVDIVYTADMDGSRTEVDTREIRETLGGGIPLNHPEVLLLIRDVFKQDATGEDADDGGRKYG